MLYQSPFVNPQARSAAMGTEETLASEDTKHPMKTLADTNPREEEIESTQCSSKF